MNIKIKLLLIISTVIITMAFPVDVRFEFNDLENVKGKIYMVVINSSKVWKESDQPDNIVENNVEFKAAVMVGEKDVSITVSGLKPGNYAAQAFHDLNGNGKLDSNALKIPKEPYGFSNNKKGVFGKPSFKDSSFTVKDKDIVHKIKFF